MPDTVDKKWLDDPLAQEGWRLTVERAKAASKMGWPAHTTPTTSHCSDVLHAEARINLINSKFQSGNSVEVDRIVITREEWFGGEG